MGTDGPSGLCLVPGGSYFFAGFCPLMKTTGKPCLFTCDTAPTSHYSSKWLNCLGRREGRMHSRYLDFSHDLLGVGTGRKMLQAWMYGVGGVGEGGGVFFDACPGDSARCCCEFWLF